MNSKRYRIPCFFLMALVSIVLSCSKMDNTYRDFIKDGEIIYPGKPESLQIFPGNGRIDLSMVLISDPKITKVRAFWNNGLDSTEKTIQRTSAADTVRFSLTGMQEGTYTFDVYTYDKDGHRSVKSDIIGSVFGDRYINSLYNRTFSSVSYMAGGKARLIWVGPADQMIGQEIRYTDSSGVLQTLIEPRYKADGTTLKDTTILTAFRKGSSFDFRTLFKPEPASLDTFYSGFETRVVQ